MSFFDPGARPGDDPYQSGPSLPADGDGNDGPVLFDPGALPGDNPYQFVTDPGGVTQTLTYHLHLDTPTVVISDGPARLLWELVEAGPYAVAIVPSDGLPHSDYTVTAQAIPNPIPGLLVGAATALFPLLVDGIAKTLSVVLGLSNGQPDVSLTLKAPLADVEAGLPGILWGGEGYVHVLTSAKGNADGGDVDYTSLPPRLAVVPADAKDSDFVDGDWLTRTTTPAGTYARLYVEDLRRGSYFVSVQITVGGQTITRQAPGTLRVTS